jgi:hypothetical protein
MELIDERPVETLTTPTIELITKGPVETATTPPTDEIWKGPVDGADSRTASAQTVEAGVALSTAAICVL